MPIYKESYDKMLNTLPNDEVSNEDLNNDFYKY